MDRQELFNHMSQDHGLTLLETEMNDIAVIIERPLKKDNHELIEMLRELYDHLEYCGWGDSWESECAASAKLPQRAGQLIERYR